jgi:hypothetical protein
MIDVADVRMTRFLLEPRKPMGIGGELDRQNLHCDVAIQPPIAREINFSHAARAEQANNLETGEPGPGRQSHDIAGLSGLYGDATAGVG